MLQIERKNIKKIVAISVAVLILILLLLYMQGSFVSKVVPGISPQTKDSHISNRDTVMVKKSRLTISLPGPAR